jgi:parallel beta-helix repeat protein
MPVNRHMFPFDVRRFRWSRGVACLRGPRRAPLPAVCRVREELMSMRSLNLSGWRLRIAAAGVLVLGASTVRAGERCVRPSGSGGCFSTIGAAVAAASAGDVVRVASGTYHEDVVIDKPLSLLGQRSETTTIDASGLLNGVNVDGVNHPGLAHVIVRGFTVRGADAQGILVTNATDVVVADNHVTGNDRSLDVANLVCPPLPPYFQAGEGFDCGEGIHLSGVSYSVVSGNLVEGNAGGILISDDTGPNHDNLVSENVVRDNPYDCGITLASHHFELAPTDPSVGVFRITVSDNTSVRNGLLTGEGAGVGIFAGPPGAQNNDNVVVDNVLRDNALPGVAMHTHAPFQGLSGHLIAGNEISGNGPDGDPGTTVPTGISVFSPVVPVRGIVITGNVFRREGIDVAVSVSAGSSLSAHLNSFSGDVGVDNLASGSISATLNWWKCSAGPGAPGCSSVAGDDVASVPWLTRPPTPQR